MWQDIINGDNLEWSNSFCQKIADGWDGERHDRLCASCM